MHPLLAAVLAAVPPGTDPVTHVENMPARPGRTSTWPDWTPPVLIDRLAERGVLAPWCHQRAAADLAHAGRSVVLATGTGSGKSLGYQLPGLAAVLSDDRVDRARVLYLAPTKALAGDQLRSLDELRLPGLRAASYDGDTAFDERAWVRTHANWMLTNPDMLHRGILPGHVHWASFLRRLRYVVIDECHAYRGVFGAQVAAVLRRLRRVCAAYGTHPTFVLASATVADPGAAAERLVGLPMAAVVDDASPRGAVSFALWQPPLVQAASAAPGELPEALEQSDCAEYPELPGPRVAAGTEAARLLVELVTAGARTLVFVRSRRGAELVALSARRGLSAMGRTDLVERVAPYRAGYLPEERRALEAALASGELLGVASTNALELGLDISGLDAVVLVGFPGTLASLWQQAGRAGRAGSNALVVFVARDDPLDTYLVNHPSAVFGRPVEASVFDPHNRHVLAPQLCCAAAELPLRPSDLDQFGGPKAETVLDDLVARGLLRRRPDGWFWTARERPLADIRGSGALVTVVEAATGSLIGTVDAAAAHTSAHPGAVYLHQGRSYVVDDLDLVGAVALVHPETPDWTTSALEVNDIAITVAELSSRHGPVVLGFGSVQVTSQTVGYLRRRIRTGEFLDETPLTLPRRELHTRAVWYSIEQDALDAVGLPELAVPGAAHAAEHAAIGLLPLLATCDRWDIGGVSTAVHPDTGTATVFVYDGQSGGAGFAERGHAELAHWLAATRSAIAACECLDGCPSCIQSPKCGSGNEPLDKAGSLRLLDLVLGHIGGRSRPGGEASRPGRREHRLLADHR
jgi:DEAD/DEAH box helicase domain-containing protein